MALSVTLFISGAEELFETLFSELLKVDGIAVSILIAYQLQAPNPREILRVSAVDPELRSSRVATRVRSEPKTNRQGASIVERPNSGLTSGRQDSAVVARTDPPCANRHSSEYAEPEGEGLVPRSRHRQEGFRAED